MADTQRTDDNALIEQAAATMYSVVNPSPPALGWPSADEAARSSLDLPALRGYYLKHARALAAAGLLAVPAPAVDREGLIRLIADASNHNPFPEAEDIADTLIETGTLRGPEAATVVTEHAIGMTDGSMQVRSPHPEIERVFPLAQWILAHQRFGGKVWRRRAVVVEDWVEVPKGGGA